MVKHINSLSIYKASAGSGKTFTLTAEYIRLLIIEPECYRNILAVTFTNKATEEMKMRILSMLYGLSRQLSEAQGYMDNITQSTGFTPIMVAKQAGEALTLLLHNYNYFKVETIDKFFQSVLRNMASELDLSANLRIALNDIQVEEQAVDELIDSLNAQDQVFKWIMQYVKENISEDKSWNVINLIKRFGKNIFRDIYRENSKRITEVISDDGFFDEYTNLLKAIKAKAENYFEQAVITFFKILDENNLEVSDFSSGTRGVCGYFIKMRDGKYSNVDLLNTTICNALEDPNKWVKKAEQKVGNPKYDLVCSTLLPLLQETERLRQNQAHLYQSASLTLRHLNQLRLLGNIEKTVRNMNGDSNRFLLSDTQYLLNGIIQESDSPFIFEKIGTRLKHIMIDEFQDTSTIQWKNFKILLLDCMSNVGSNNLIVGDVKQSIYRWRSGDWRLLNNIETEFASQSHPIKIESLITNRRSEYNIVIFNNIFFKLAAKAEGRSLENSHEAEQLTHAYADVEQKPYKTTQLGRVEITLMPSDEYKEFIMGNIFKTIENLLQNGYNPGSIAILCRSKSTIQNIATYFNENYPQIPLVSDEAFRLDSSETVNTIISALRFITNPNNDIERAYLEHYGILKQIEQSREFLITMPLYDMVQKIYGMIDNKKNVNQSAYIFAFFDQITKYVNDNIPDINNFIEEWDLNLHEKSIQSSDNSGIRLLTIHKSKGLEFEHIIIPACDWRLEQQSTLWCIPKTKPFSKMPLVPIDFSKKNMENTIYEDDYYYEHLQNVVDNLNLLYVAFTRAKTSLYIFGKRGPSTMRSALIENIWEDLANELHISYIGNLQEKKDSLHLEFGVLPESQSSTCSNSKESNQKNVFQDSYTNLNIQAINTFESVATFRQSNQSMEFVSDNVSGEHDQYIKLGNLLHKIFSSIRTADDIDHALLQLENEGVLYTEDTKKEELINMLRSRLQNPKVSNWFSPKWTVLNERSILFYNDIEHKTHQLRPDRVITDGNQYIVIDFKFGSPKEEYHNQVKQYMHILKQMGYDNVTGFLWFVYSNKIEEVL